jgi:HAD superfamily hydrolase (TIGR01490 family)
MIHIFDVDQTVIKRTSAQYFLQEALKDKYINIWQLRRLPFDLIKYKLAIPDFDFIENSAKKFAGIDEKNFETVSNNCFERRIKKNIFPGAAKLIKEALERGEKVIFATSSFNFIIAPLEKYFGIKGSIASKLEFKDGKTTGNLCGESFFGNKKKIAAVQWLEQNKINPKDACFYSDSYTDIPLLEYCGIAIAVNPDRILAKEAKKRGWKILKFTL